MRKFGAGLLILSNVVGNAACAVAAYYAVASYYGWNQPSAARAIPPGHIAMPANMSSVVVVVTLALIGFALLAPSWVVVFHALGVQENGRTTNGRTTMEIARPATTADPSIPPYGSSDPGPCMDLCANRTAVEIRQIVADHEGEILELSGLVYDVSSYDDQSATISIDPDPDRRGLIQARVSVKDRAIRAAALRKGDKIKVRGKILGLSPNSITLNECEFTRL